jgi:hypothetical protein
VLLRALGAPPRRRKPAFITHDNEASLCEDIEEDDDKLYNDKDLLNKINNLIYRK